MELSHMAVLIKSGSDPIGSGCVVGFNRVLTAGHVVSAADRPRANLTVSWDAFHATQKADVIWCGLPLLDVSVLASDLPDSKGINTLGLLSDRLIHSGEDWEARGYPVVRTEQPSGSLEKVVGNTCSCSGSDHSLSLNAPVQPDDWRGFSGAAVSVEGQLVGVIRSIAAGWRGMRVEATPAARFLSNPDFRRAIGVAAEYDRMEVRLVRLTSELAQSFSHRALVTAAIARHIGEDCCDLPAFAERLIRGRRAADLARALNCVDSDFFRENHEIEDRRMVRTLLWRFLPLAIDWRQLVVDGRLRIASGSNQIELPLSSETIAEIVLAGIDDRLCCFRLADAGDLPVGAALIRLPAAAHAPVFDLDGTRLARLVVEQIAAAKGINAHPYDKKLDRVRAALQYAASSAPDAERLPYYLLFEREGDAAAEGLWSLARASLTSELPSLRLVRITGGNSRADEYGLGEIIKAIYVRPLGART
ncbi:MAG: serine protease [Thermoanaerobaculia bacterium]|nr:serine protease [Thermoanaerobaculia bacterium]